MVNHVCKYYSIRTGNIAFGCDGLSALQQCFNPSWRISPNTPHYNLISATRSALKQSPIKWHWHHILGHQDQVKNQQELSTFEVLNIQMDNKAKWWWETISQAKLKPHNLTIPREGWAIWLNHCKLATFSCEVFDTHSTQYQYSNKYGNNPRN